MQEPGHSWFLIQSLRIGGNNWKEPFNNKYVNERRRPLPRALTNNQIVSKVAPEGLQSGLYAGHIPGIEGY